MIYLRRQGTTTVLESVARVADLREALAKLWGKLGVERILSTSPGRLGGALLRAEPVDEINVELFPAIIGGKQTPALVDSWELRPEEWPTRVTLMSAQVQSGGRV
jgi:riboflavin biosynthesis pyrimidine reductase